MQQYQDAVWQYIIEHSDVNDHGALFVKFHTDGRGTFERRIRARIRGYSRKDTRLNMTTQEKELLHVTRRAAFITEKKAKREKWKAETAERRRILAEVKWQNEINAKVRQYPKWCQPAIHMLLAAYTASRTKLLYYRAKVSRTGRRDSQSRR